MKPTHWAVYADGHHVRDYLQRAAANGAAMILRAQGRIVRIEAKGY